MRVFFECICVQSSAEKESTGKLAGEMREMGQVSSLFSRILLQYGCRKQQKKKKS